MRPSWTLTLVKSPRGLAVALAIVVAAFVGVSVAQASKGVTSYFGNPGTATGTVGGEFNVPRGVAVNDSSVVDASDGAIYVVDDNNHRVQKFDAAGGFLRAWGRDVDSGGGTDFEICTVAGSCKAGSFGTTADGPAGELDNPQGIAVDQSDGAVYVVDRDNRRVQKFDADGNFLRMWGKDVDTAAGTGAEVCTVAANCKIGVTGNLGGEFAATFTGGIAVVPAGAPNAGNVVVTDPANRRVQEFTSAGVFVRAFGLDVAGAGAGADNTGTGFEVCTAAVAGAANCKIAATASAPVPVGGFPSNQPTRVAADSTGAIYTVETATSFRVQKFTPQAGPPALAPAVFADALLTGTSSSTNPTDVAIGASNHVFVTKAYLAGAGAPPADANERRVLELDAAGTLLDTHLAGSGINSANGLAADPSNGAVYVSSQSYGVSPATPAHRVYILEDVVPPTVTVEPPTGVSARGATFHGQINPGGLESSYRFEYSDDGIDWTELPLVSAGSSATDVAATQTVTDALKPNTLYQVRLVGKLDWGFETSTSAATTFMTDPAPPNVGAVTSAATQATGATLSGRVNPNSQATSYRFEYGTTTAYGTTTPDGDAGDGDVPALVQKTVAGLQPGTTYHFRLLATNVTGTTVGEDNTFTTDVSACANDAYRQGPSALLPDCRAYEQVSPTDKNGNDVSETSTGPVSPDGETALFRSFGAFAGYPTGGWGGKPDNYYYARRGADGWSTVPGTPRPAVTTAQRDIVALASDLTVSLLLPIATPFEPDTPPPPAFNHFYLHQNITGGTERLFTLHNQENRSFAASSDLGHIAFSSESVLTDDPGIPPTGYKVYERTEGEIRLVSRQPGTDEPLAATAVLAGTKSSYSPNSSSPSGAGAVSADGAKIFFETPGDIDGPDGDTAVIYRRSDGTTTELASPSQRTPTDPAGQRQKTFRSATPDGNRVFFTSAELLTDDANTGPGRDGSDLYRYDMAAGELRDISATPGGDGARVQGVIGVSDDGDRVYYAALGEVVPGGIAGQPNVYLWTDDGSPAGNTRFVTTLDNTGDDANPRDLLNWTTSGDKRSHVTSDGRYALLGSRRSLTGYPHGGLNEVYLYDADANGGAGTLVCVSCNPRDFPPLGESVPGGRAVGGVRPRNLSDDGKYVFFDSDDALVPRDTNGQTDVYVWSGGEVDLLSSGKGTSPSRFFSASADGSRAFFATRERMVGQDVDSNMDLYVASIGGGLASQQAKAPPTCADDECQGPGTGAPRLDDPASSRFEGAGDVPVDQRARSCATLVRNAGRAKKSARKLARRARRASGQRASRLKTRHRVAKKRATRAVRKAQQCKRGSK